MGTTSWDGTAEAPTERDYERKIKGAAGTCLSRI